MISGGVVGAFAEYHNIDATKPKGNWIVSCFKSEGSQRAWKVIEENGKHVMYQAYTSDNEEIKYTHPVLIAGDSLWRNYNLEIKLSPQSKEEQSGVIFRYKNDRCYYFFGVRSNKAFLKKVNHAKSFHTLDETILAEANFNFNPGEIIIVSIIVNGNKISAKVNESLTLNAEDSTFPKGKIGLLADIPTYYYSVKVTAKEDSYDDFLKKKSSYEKEIQELRKENPKPVIWKKIMLGDFGAP